jgi:hypothetical protein
VLQVSDISKVAYRQVENLHDFYRNSSDEAGIALKLSLPLFFCPPSPGLRRAQYPERIKVAT